MDFIRLTDATTKNPVYVKVEDISSIDTDEWNNKTSTAIQTPYAKLYVKESPDQVMQRLQFDDKNAIRIFLNNGFKIAAKLGTDDSDRVIHIYIEEPNGNMFQDIATVEPHTIIRDEKLIQLDDTFCLKVWADDIDDDFTNQFIIDRYPYY